MNDNDDFENLTPEEKLQKENELLKLKLQSEFGMEKMDSSLDKETENKWLNDVYNFEKQFAENKQCKVYDFINRPKFRRVDELTKEEISKELEKLTEIMRTNGIELSTICDYEDEIIYRFITEELFNQETDDVHVHGMMNCFIYEEFHPNHDYDIREHCNEFVECLISKKWDEFSYNGKIEKDTIDHALETIKNFLLYQIDLQIKLNNQFITDSKDERLHLEMMKRNQELQDEKKSLLGSKNK